MDVIGRNAKGQNKQAIIRKWEWVLEEEQASVLQENPVEIIKNTGGGRVPHAAPGRKLYMR